MTVTASKYRLGAPSSIILDLNGPSPIDLGSSMGGVTFTYKPTYFEAVADQTISAVAAWRTMEKATIEFACPEMSVAHLLAASGYDGAAVTTIPGGTLGVPSAATIGTIVGGGAASISYKIFAYTSAGDGIPLAAVLTAVAPAVLAPGTGTVALVLPALPAGAVGFGIIRFAGGPNQGLIGRTDASSGSFVDSGQTAVPYTPSAAQPTYPGSDTGYIGGQVAIAMHQLDLIVPKNVMGSTNNWRWTFWQVYAGGSPVIDWKRDKNSEFKVQYEVLALPTKPVGQQLYRKVEETP